MHISYFRPIPQCTVRPWSFHAASHDFPSNSLLQASPDDASFTPEVKHPSFYPRICTTAHFRFRPLHLHDAPLLPSALRRCAFRFEAAVATCTSARLATAGRTCMQSLEMHARLVCLLYTSTLIVSTTCARICALRSGKGKREKGKEWCNSNGRTYIVQRHGMFVPQRDRAQLLRATRQCLRWSRGRTLVASIFASLRN
jgi:hypothetical protein